MTDREILRRRMAKAIDEGRDEDAHLILPEWRTAVAADALAELAAKGPSDDLCGPSPADCDGYVRVMGYKLKCPLDDLCHPDGDAGNSEETTP